MDPDPGIIIYISVLLLLLASGLFSGLTLGLLSLSKSDLKRKKDLGDRYANRVYPIRKRGNLLLCTLLLGNVAVNSAISILLANASGGLIAGLVSTATILIFGEILPQAFVSKHALLVGYHTASITKVIIWMFYPIAWPISKALDWMLGGEEATIYSHEELKKIINEHGESEDSELDIDEERILLGALSYSHKKTNQIMTQVGKAYVLDKETILDSTLIREIREERHTRIPVFDSDINNMVGILYSKDLIGVTEEDEIIVKQIYENKVLKVSYGEKLDTLLNTFLREREHLAVVYNKDSFIGIVTLEDVLEEILGREVYDEND